MSCTSVRVLLSHRLCPAAAPKLDAVSLFWRASSHSCTTCGVQGSGFRVQGSGCRVQGSGFGVQGSGFRVQGSGFGVQGLLGSLSLGNMKWMTTCVPCSSWDMACRSSSLTINDFISLSLISSLEISTSPPPALSIPCPESGVDLRSQQDVEPSGATFHSIICR